jgi:hypothetical protein
MRVQVLGEPVIAPESLLQYRQCGRFAAAARQTPANTGLADDPTRSERAQVAR